MEKKLKILFIEEVCVIGGSTTCLSRMIGGLSKEEHDITLILFFSDKAIEQQLFPGIKIYHFGKFFDKKYFSYPDGRSVFNKINKYLVLLLVGLLFVAEGARRVIKTLWVIKRNRVELVHVNNSLGLNFYSILAAKLAGIPCVCHIRNFEGMYAPQRWSLRLVTKIITISHAVTRHFQTSLRLLKNFPQPDMSLIYDGLDESELAYDYSTNSALRKEFNLPGDRVIIGFVGMLSEWKGVHILLEAISIAKRTIPEITALVVGEAPKPNHSYINDLRALVDKLGVSENVIFTGMRLDTCEVFASIDICVHASINPEPFGRVVIEAMAASKPVIAVNAGGPAEVITDGVNGLLYPAGDAVALSQLIIRLHDDADERARLGKNARQHVEKYFIQTALIEKMDVIYSEILHTKPVRG